MFANFFLARVLYIQAHMKNKKETCFETFPKKENIIQFLSEVRKYLFPGYFEKLNGDVDRHQQKKLKKISKLYKKYVCSFTYELFEKELKGLREKCLKDLDFFFESDPASEAKDEIVITYPGFLAITYYRIAHIIYDLAVPFVPRIITELAHSETGIDIHPGCKIGVPFFIDHGTGIVIGETSEIGNFVKMYHGVTLGALSLKEGRNLEGKKRHPTIKDYVTIYSGASILGGETVIEEKAVIGSNVFIVNSVVKGTKVIYSQDLINKFIN